jgi:hypothetical protein
MKYFRSVPAGLVVMVLVAGASGAATPERSPAIGANLLPFQLQLDPQVENDGVTLSVSGPDNFYYRQSFAVSEPVVFSLEQDGAPLADGVYTWEAVLTPRLGGETLRAMAEARAGGDESAEGRLRAAGKLPAEPMIDSGSFRIHQGAILTDQGPERAPASDAPSGGMTRVASPDVVRVAAADFVIADDLIVDGSACIGFDCVNGESFGFDTIRLKENNLRIKFDDTSTASGFPNRDWQLTANDSASGGRNKFSIDDITGGRTPFTIEAAAPSNSLYVDDAGRVGFGTSNPVLELHVSNGDSPALRLEQNASSGFAAQTWDIAGNETNFFVRDVTSGSTLPFRIQPGAPSSSVFIASDGDVGIGTASPSEPVHLRTSGEPAGFFLETTGVPANSNWFFQSNPATGAFIISNTSGGAAPVQVFPGQDPGLLVLTGNRVGIGTTPAVGAKLDVDGPIFQRSTSLHPDFVFEDDYELLSIEENADYMWAHKHLPSIGPGTYDPEGRAVIDLARRSQGLLEELEKAHIYIEQLNHRLRHLEDRQANLDRICSAVDSGFPDSNGRLTVDRLQPLQLHEADQ